jgi:hypothetical protein
MSRFTTVRPAPGRWPVITLLLGMPFLAIGAREAAAADPARFVPARGLSFYVEYDGLGSHADAWKATAAYQLLHQTPAGPMITDIARWLLTRDPDAAHTKVITDADMAAVGEHFVQQGFAFASYDDDGETSLVIVVHGVGGKDRRDRLARFIRWLAWTEDRVPELPAPTRLHGRDLYRLRDRDAAGNEAQAPWTWWFEGDDLIVVPGQHGAVFAAASQPDDLKKGTAGMLEARVAAVLDTIDGKQPDASTHPGLVAARAEGRDLAGFDANGLFFAESRNRLGKGVIGSLLESPPGMTTGDAKALDILDISRARRIVGRWGFRGRSLLTDLRIRPDPCWSARFD